MEPENILRVNVPRCIVIMREVSNQERVTILNTRLLILM